MESLPAEIWERIFQTLPMKDLKNLLLVNRFVSSVASNPHLWTNVNIKWKRIAENAESKEFFSLRRFSLIEKMHLPGRDMDSTHVKQMLVGSLGLESLQCIDAGRNNLNGICSDLLVNAVERMTIVNLGCTQLNADQCNSVLRAIIASSSLAELHLVEINLSQVAANVLADVAKKLKIINLMDTRLNLHQLEMILHATIASQTLVDVDLSKNDLSKVPAATLADAMKKLKSINLRFTCLDDQQIESVFNAIITSQSLQEVHLRGNSLCEVPPDVLARAAAKVSRADLADTDLDCSQLTAIILSALNSHLLIDLDLTENDDSDLPEELINISKKIFVSY